MPHVSETGPDAVVVVVAGVPEEQAVRSSAVAAAAARRGVFLMMCVLSANECSIRRTRTRRVWRLTTGELEPHAHALRLVRAEVVTLLELHSRPVASQSGGRVQKPAAHGSLTSRSGPLPCRLDRAPLRHLSLSNRFLNCRRRLCKPSMGAHPSSPKRYRETAMCRDTRFGPSPAPSSPVSSTRCRRAVRPHEPLPVPLITRESQRGCQLGTHVNAGPP